MSVSVEQVRDAVIRARERVISSGVGGAEVDAIASTIAAIELIEGRASNETAANTTPLLAFPETFAEWSADFNLESHYDRFLAAGIYLREKQRLASVNNDDIMQMYKKARWERPANPADVLAKAAKRLYFTEADTPSEGEETKRKWQVTRSGYEYFQTLKKENGNG